MATPTQHADPVAVLLRITCLNGFWAGAEHYHHILPPPPPPYFDAARFLRTTKNERGIVRIAARYLVGNAARVEEEVGWLFEDVMEELRGVYDEEMVKMGDWVLLQSDFDGGAVDSTMSLEELIDKFLATGPAVGEPLVLTPIPRWLLAEE